MSSVWCFPWPAAEIEVYSHVRRASFRLINWGRAKDAQQLVEGEDGLGFNLFYGGYADDDKANFIRAGVDFMSRCTMGGGHQMDLRQECDWSDPYVTRGGTRRVVQRAFIDEMARARDFAKPCWYLPTWYGNTPSERFRLEQNLSFMTNLQGMMCPPDIAHFEPAKKPAAGLCELRPPLQLRRVDRFLPLPTFVRGPMFQPPPLGLLRAEQECLRIAVEEEGL